MNVNVNTRISGPDSSDDNRYKVNQFLNVKTSTFIHKQVNFYVSGFLIILRFIATMSTVFLQNIHRFFIVPNVSVYYCHESIN